MSAFNKKFNCSPWACIQKITLGDDVTQSEEVLMTNPKWIEKEKLKLDSQLPANICTSQMYSVDSKGMYMYMHVTEHLAEFINWGKIVTVSTVDIGAKAAMVTKYSITYGYISMAKLVWTYNVSPMLI